jgi:hypothetical protein
MGQPLAGLIISPPLRQAHQAGLDRYLATGEGPVLGQHLELTAVRADGSELPVELSITKVALPGPPVFTACLRALTGRRQARAEQQAPGKRLRQSERLQSLGSRPGARRTTSTTCSGSPCTMPPSSCSAPPVTRPPVPTPNRSGPPPSRARCNPRVLAGLSAVQTAGRLGNPASAPPG